MTTTTTRRAMLAIGAAIPALATSQALGVSSSWAAAPDAAIAAERAAEIVRVLRTYHVRDGWRIDDDAADRALAWFNGRVTGRVSDEEPMTDEDMAAMRFLGDHGQSLDWVFMGDTTGMICDGAVHSKQAARCVAVADPIFAALDAFRRTWDATESWPGPDDIPDHLGTRWCEAKAALLSTRPTTPAGLAALTGCVRDEWSEREMSERWRGYRWLDEDLETLSTNIDDAVRGMAGLKPWSPPVISGATDPIFAAIEAHSAAADEAEARHDDHRTNHEKYAECEYGEKPPTFHATYDAWNDAAEIAQEKLRALATTKPTTLVGVAAAAAYLADHLAELAPDDFMDGKDVDDTPSFSVAFMDVIAEALATLAEGGAA